MDQYYYTNIQKIVEKGILIWSISVTILSETKNVTFHFVKNLIRLFTFIYVYMWCTKYWENEIDMYVCVITEETMCKC